MAVFKRAAFAPLFVSLGCCGGTEPPKVAQDAQPRRGTAAAERSAVEPAPAAPAAPAADLPEAAYPPACDDYMEALISLRQAQKDAGKKGDVPEREQLQLNYRREAAKRDYDKMAEACAAGLNWALNARGKVPPPTVPPEASADAPPE